MIHDLKTALSTPTLGAAAFVNRTRFACQEIGELAAQLDFDCKNVAAANKTGNIVIIANSVEGLSRHLLQAFKLLEPLAQQLQSPELKSLIAAERERLAGQ